MVLDAGTVMMDVEAAFGVGTQGRGAGEVATVGDLHQDLLARLGRLGGPDRLRRLVYYRLRRALITSQGIAPGRIHPGVPLAELLPEATRHRDWNRLGRALGLKLPGLDRPGWVYTVVLPAWSVGIVSAVFLALVSVFDRYGEIFARDPLLLGAGLGLSVTIGIELATRRLERALPEGCEVVGGLVEAIVARNARQLARVGTNQADEELWTAVRDAVAARYQVDPATITRATRFADLGG